jgi:hypothetical protein
MRMLGYRSGRLAVIALTATSVFAAGALAELRRRLILM